MNKDKEQKIDINKKYRTRDGRKVVLYTVNGVNKASPVVGALQNTDFSWSNISWMKCGSYLSSRESPSDLIEDTNEIECDTHDNRLIEVDKAGDLVCVSILSGDNSLEYVSLSPTKTRQLIQMLEEAIDD